MTIHRKQKRFYILVHRRAGIVINRIPVVILARRAT